MFGNLHGAMHSYGLRSRPGGLMRKVGGCGLAGRSNERGGIGWGEMEWEFVYDLMEFMVDYCAERKNREEAVAVA